MGGPRRDARERAPCRRRMELTGSVEDVWGKCGKWRRVKGGTFCRGAQGDGGEGVRGIECRR